ncbi:MAG: helix-turn-helix domain-containing protein [Candidatus Methanoplasma sp.]|jgi:predicted DNA binding protein|nr:helix-turn-helix domain-containing protein [Candidatus Methanoplasma sp.]
MYYVKLVVNESSGGNSCFELMPEQIRRPDTGTRLEVIQCTCLANDGGCSMIRITDPDGILSDDITDRLSYFDARGECTIDRISSHQLIAIVMNNNCQISRILSESGCLVTSAVMEDGDDICWTIVSPNAERVRNLIERLGEIGVSVRRKSTINANLATLLSDRQEEAVRVAIENGYYEVPRKINIDGLCRIMGCSKSTLDVTLRNAERKIMNQHVLQGRNSIVGRNKYW